MIFTIEVLVKVFDEGKVGVVDRVVCEVGRFGHPVENSERGDKSAAAEEVERVHVVREIHRAEFQGVFEHFGEVGSEEVGGRCLVGCDVVEGADVDAEGVASHFLPLGAKCVLIRFSWAEPGGVSVRVPLVAI